MSNPEIIVEYFAVYFPVHPTGTESNFKEMGQATYIYIYYLKKKTLGRVRERVILFIPRSPGKTSETD